MRPFFKVCIGRTRLVILVGKLAFKFPNVTSWKWALRGLLDNMFEYQHRNVRPEALAPIFFFIQGGFLNVMPRVDVFTVVDCEPIKEYFKELYHDWNVNNERTAFDTLDMIEVAEPRNFGYYKGKVVATDYGHNREAGLNQFIVEEWFRKEKDEVNNI